MILQLNPPLPVITPKGKALAHFMIDEGIEHDIKWVCFQDSTGECWTFSNPEIRVQKNITQGRDYISPFYNPDDVKLNPEGGYICMKCHGHNQCYCDYEELKKENEKLMEMNRQIIEEYKRPSCRMCQQIEAAKKMMNTPNFEDLVKDANSISNNSHQEKIQEQISKVASELRGNEMKILDDFCKTYYAAVGHMTGKEFMSIVNDVTLNVQQFFKDGQVGTRYWFSPKEKDENR